MNGTAMTAAEQLAAAIQRVLDETVDRALNGHAADASLRITAAGKLLGFSPSYVLRLCKEGVLESTGEGRRRRIPMSSIVAYRKRARSGRERVQDFGLTRRAGAASANHH